MNLDIVWCDRATQIDPSFAKNDRSIFGRLIVFPIKFRIRAVFWPHYSASPSFIHRLALVMRDGVAVQQNVSYLFLAGTALRVRFSSEIIMQKKVQFWMLMLVVASAAAVLSAPKETPKVTSADRAEPEVITNSMSMKLVRIPAGEFMMGAEEDRDTTMAAFPYADPALLPREWPRHRVRIKIILHGAT